MRGGFRARGDRRVSNPAEQAGEGAEPSAADARGLVREPGRAPRRLRPELAIRTCHSDLPLGLASRTCQPGLASRDWPEFNCRATLGDVNVLVTPHDRG